MSETLRLLSDSDTDALVLAKKIVRLGKKHKGFEDAQKIIATIGECLRAGKPCTSFSTIIFLSKYENEV